MATARLGQVNRSLRDYGYAEPAADLAGQSPLPLGAAPPLLS